MSKEILYGNFYYGTLVAYSTDNFNRLVSSATNAKNIQTKKAAPTGAYR
jgi:hypothetical protein